MTQAGAFDFGKYHPLFLPEDGSNEEDFGPPVGSKELKMIQAVRIERGEEVKLLPGRLDPNDLRAEEDIYSRWGAGTYILTARTVNGVVYAKRRFVLRDPNAAAAPAAQQQGAFPTTGLSGNDGVILAVLQMMNQNMQADRDREARMAQERERSQREGSMMMMQMQQQQTQMLVAVLGNAGNTQSEMMRQTMALMATAKQGGAGANDAIKSLQGVYDLAKTMAPKASGADGFDWTQLAQLVGGFFGGMAEASKQNQQQPQTVTVQAEPVQPQQQPAPVMGPNGETPAG